MIERVLGLNAKFELHLLAHRELPPQRQIRGERPRAAGAAQRSRSIAQRQIVRALENGVIRNAVVHPIRPMLASVRPSPATRPRQALSTGAETGYGSAPEI